MSRLLPLLLIISLLFFSLSPPTSAHEYHHQASLIPHTRVLSQQHFQEGRRLLSSFQLPRKLKIYMKKRVSGSGAGVATRARGKTSAAFRTTQISFFPVASVLASSLLLGFFAL